MKKLFVVLLLSSSLASTQTHLSQNRVITGEDVGVGLGVSLVPCPSGNSLCVTGQLNPNSVDGIVLATGMVGDSVPVLMYGSSFTYQSVNPAIVGDVAVFFAGALQDSGVTDLSKVPCELPVAGKIEGVQDTFLATVNFTMPGLRGGLISPNCIDQPAFITFIQNNQNTSVGPRGPQGIQGITGPAGSQGPTGAQGPQGFQGAIGPQGLQGPAGSSGANGANGLNGTNGTNGSVGAQGPAGMLWFAADGTPITGMKCAIFNTTTAATTGAWSINYSALSLTAVPKSISPVAYINGANVANAVIVNTVGSSITTTGASGIATGSKGVLLGAADSLGFTLTPVAIVVTVCGK